MALYCFLTINVLPNFWSQKFISWHHLFIAARNLLASLCIWRASINRLLPISMSASVYFDINVCYASQGGGANPPPPPPPILLCSHIRSPGYVGALELGEWNYIIVVSVPLKFFRCWDMLQKRLCMHCLTVNFSSNNFPMSFWLCYQYTNKPNMQLEVMAISSQALCIYGGLHSCTGSWDMAPHGFHGSIRAAVLPGLCKRFLIATMKQYLLRGKKPITKG